MIVMGAALKFLAKCKKARVSSLNKEDSEWGGGGGGG